MNATLPKAPLVSLDLPAVYDDFNSHARTCPRCSDGSPDLCLMGELLLDLALAAAGLMLMESGFGVPRS